MQDTFHILDALDEECLGCVSGDLWSDIACALYCFITNRIGEESQFIAGYLKSGNGETSNPNLPAYVKFEESAYQIISECSEPYPSNEALSLIRSELELVALAPYMDNAKCALALLFHLIKAIDRFIGDTKRSIHRILKRGPLNARHGESVGLYLRSSNHFFGDFFDHCSIRHHMSVGLLNEQLTTVYFYRKESGFALPRIVPSSSVGCPSKTARSIRVAVAPFRGAAIPSPDDSSGEFDVRFQYERGSLFGCRYSDAYGQHLFERLTVIVQRAANAGCKVLLFPEFVVTEDMVEALGCAMRSLGDSSDLQLIVAGSWWNPDERHNVGALVLDEGRITKQFDKFAPFVKDGPRGNYTEMLERDEKRTMLVDMPGIGLVLPQICRDVVEAEKRLCGVAKVFQPAAVLAPAWSPSIHEGFKLPLSNLAARQNSFCVIANACGARRDALADDERENPAVSLCASPVVVNGRRGPRRSADPVLEYLPVNCMGECLSHCCSLWIVDVTCESVEANGKIVDASISVMSEFRQE